MNAILSFKNLEEELSDNCPCKEELREALRSFHDNMIGKTVEKRKEEEKEEEKPQEEHKVIDEPPENWSLGFKKIINLVKKTEDSHSGEAGDDKGSPEGIACIFTFINLLGIIIC